MTEGHGSSSSSSGVGFVGLLTILFVALKLIKIDGEPIIDWSWLWVLSPLWISAILVTMLLVIMGLGAILYATRKKDSE